MKYSMQASTSNCPCFSNGSNIFCQKSICNFILIGFFLVIAQSPTKRGARPYIRNHFSVCFARLRISMLKAFNSLVRCSNMMI